MKTEGFLKIVVSLFQLGLSGSKLWLIGLIFLKRVSFAMERNRIVEEDELEFEKTS